MLSKIESAVYKRKLVVDDHLFSLASFSAVGLSYVLRSAASGGKRCRQT